MKQTVIGLCGRKRVGKDTIAERLVLDYGFAQTSFAAPIKAGLVAMHEAGQFLAVVGVGGSDGAAVDKPRFAVGADVQFHAEVPLPTFFGGVHFGVAGFVGVFGGAGCGDDGGVYNGAVGELESCVEE